MLGSICASINTPYVIRYLQSIGFSDVTVNRQTNPYNGRKNVRMVRAVKI